MNTNIKTMEELEKEQEKLKALMKLTRHEFVQSISSNKTHFKSFLLKKVAIPAGIVGVGIKGIQQFSNSKKTNKRASVSKNLLQSLLPIGINLFQAYFLKQQAAKAKKVSTNKTPNTIA